MGNLGLDSTEILVYDFSLNVGDTICSSNWDMAVFNSIPTPPYIEWKDCYSAIIDSIGSIILNNGDTARIFHFSPVTPFPDFGTLGNDYLIEGIGGMNGFLFPFKNEFENSVDLACVKDNGVNLFDASVWLWGGYSCGTIVSTNDKKEEFTSFELYPNPNNGENILISGKDLDLINIYNLHGQLITTIVIKNEETLINIENQPKGIYLIKAQFKNGGIATKKLIIN